LNHRKVFGTLAGFVILAGISYHQVRDAGPDPRDTAIMSGTVLSSERVSRRVAAVKVKAAEADPACEASTAGRLDGADCPGMQP
jgi:hypothetical protein